MNLPRRLQDLQDADLEALLRRRTEAASLKGSKDAGWWQLAALLSRPGNVVRALGSLNRFLRQVVELACLEGGFLTPAAAAREGLVPKHLRIARTELVRWGLAFGEPDGSLALLPEVVKLIRDPGGLGPSAGTLLDLLTVDRLRLIAAALGLRGPALPGRKGELIAAITARLAEPERVSALLGGAPAAARALFEDLREAGAAGERLRLGRVAGPWSWRMQPETATDGPWWLVARGLACCTDGVGEDLVVPAEVERALRGQVFAGWPLVAPELRPVPLGEARHPLEVVATVTSMLRAWAVEPVPALQQGGVPKRELKRLGQRLGCDEAEAVRLVAVAARAGLLMEEELVPERRSRSRRKPRVIESRQAVITPSPEAAAWERLPEPERWLALAVPALLPPPGPLEASPDLEPAMGLMLGLLAALPAGHGASAEPLSQRLLWEHPAVFRDPIMIERSVRSLGSVLAWLGAGSADPAIGLSAAGRVAYAPGGGDARALGRAFPASIETCTVTADHRIVVAGPPSVDLSLVLSRMADVVSLHPARVYRLSEESVRRAIDAGMQAAEIIAVLSARAPRGLPGNVAALIEDVGRRHGRLRVGASSAYVVADDEGQLEQLLRARAGRALKLRRIAPTVAVVEGQGREQVMAALRLAGVMPVADGAPASMPAADAAPAARPRPAAAAVASPPVARRPAPAPRASRTLDRAGARALAAALRAGPDASEGEPASAPDVSVRVREALDDAVRRRRRVELGYAPGPYEEPVTMQVEPFSIQGDELAAIDRRAGRIARLSLARVLWVTEPVAAVGGMQPALFPGDEGDRGEFIIELPMRPS